MHRAAAVLLPALCFCAGNGLAAAPPASSSSHNSAVSVADGSPEALRGPAAVIPPQLLDSPAATQIKKLPKEVVNARAPRRFSQAAEREQAAALDRSIDEIRVVADRDPDDVARKVAPFDSFRDRLENDKRRSPADIAKLGLCFIGLCGANYGPDGAPIESKAFTRSESAKARSTLELGRTSGTLQ